MMPQIDWNPGVATIVISAMAIAAAVFALRRASGAADKGRTGYTLAAIRTATLALIAIAAWRPTIILPADDAAPRVTIVLDNSTSMAERSVPRSDAEWVRVAEALGAIAPPQHERAGRAAADGLRAVSRSMRGGDRGNAAAGMESAAEALDAIAARLSKHAPAAELAARVTRIATKARDGIKRQDVRRELEAVIGELRRAEARADEKMLRDNAGVRAAVGALRTASRFDLARRAVSALTKRLEGKADVRVVTLDRSPVSADADAVAGAAMATASPLVAAVRGAVQGASGASAVVLVSDGRSTEPRTSVPPALAAADVPVFTVTTSNTRREARAAVLRIEGPRSVYAGERAAVRVVLRSTLAQGRAVDVTLHGAGPAVTKQVVLRGDDDAVGFDIVAGSTSLDLSAEVGPLPGEREATGAAAGLRIDVLPRVVRVLILAGGASADARAMRDALMRMPWCDVLAETPGASGFALPDGVREDVDLIVLGAADINALSDARIVALRAAIERDGKSLLLLPQAAASARPALTPLLPQREGGGVWRTAPGGEAVVQPVPTRAASALLRDDAQDAWLSRPRLTRYLDLGALRPGAVVLAAARTSQAPLVVEHAAGAGRVMSLAVDEVWRWRDSVTGAADEPADEAFWLAAVRQLVDPPPDARSGDVALDVAVDDTAVGQGVDVRVRASPGAADVAVALVQGGRVIARQPLAPVLPGGGWFAGVLTPTEAGAFVVRAEAGGDAVGVALNVRAAGTDEDADLTPDPDLLRRLADATGGEFAGLDDLAALADRIAAVPGNRDARAGTYALWCSPYVFGLVVGLLGLEWTIRKWLGRA